MIIVKRRLNTVFVIACMFSCILFYSCGGSSPGPQEPLLPAIEKQSKFSDRFQLDRFQLEEDPQFFYDLFGDELLKGNKTTVCCFD